MKTEGSFGMKYFVPDTNTLKHCLHIVVLAIPARS